MGLRRAFGLGLVVAAMGCFLARTDEAAGAPREERGAPERVRILDVPFVPQSEALCGGAAVAMVQRFWGETGVQAEDFAALLESGHDGIRTGTLVSALSASGWSALAWPGTPIDVRGHLAQGRPIIALIRVRKDSYHYVVLAAWANGWVVLHDPNSGPFRTMREAEFADAWSGTENWALLLLPRPRSRERDVRPAVDSSTPPVAPTGCDALLEAGVLLARQGETVEAELTFLATQSLCPDFAGPLRERAGLRFRADDWEGASRLAESALALDPNDAHAWRLLAGSRFLSGEVEGALAAWNHVSEPRTDLTRVDGLTRIRYATVTDQLDLPPGRLLTPAAFRQARRRLAEIPAQSGFRLSLKPLPGGTTRVNVTLLERPRVFDDRWGVGRAGVRALTGREISLAIASPTGNGEVWVAGWRWWENRPRVSFALAVPAAGGRPGIWRLEGFWEQQAYAVPAPPGTAGAAGAAVTREERRRTALSFSDWLGPDLRFEIGAALDTWVDRGVYLSLDGNMESRWVNDRVALLVQGARWAGLENDVPFGTGGASLTWCETGLERCDAWQGRLGIFHATSHAPLALWSGAGTGHGRVPLLRAHPLLDGGILTGRVFGRTLAHGTIERQAWPWTVGPTRLGWALFLDAAKTWDPGRAGPGERTPWQVDGGTGLRLRSPGGKGQLRIDAARGFEDGRSAVSVGWRMP